MSQTNDESTTSPTGIPTAGAADPAMGEPAAQSGPGSQGGGEAAAETAALKAQVADLKDRLLRAMADTENLRKRAEREREDTAKYAVTGFARSLLPVPDSLRRALEAVPPGSRESDPALDSLLQGVEATARELANAFERHGIKQIVPLGQKFDPNFHQALFEVPDTESAPGTVVQVVEPGYTIADRLLKPALVGVAKPPVGDSPRVDTTA